MTSKEKHDKHSVAGTDWRNSTTTPRTTTTTSIGSRSSTNTGSSNTDKGKTQPRRRERGEGDGWGERGGYMNAKKQKLADQFEVNRSQDGDKEGSCTNIFKGVSIHVNGYTRPSSDELKRLMSVHGGRYQHYMSKTHVSHVIATNLPNSKIRDLKGADKVVRPEWITDSIKAGKLLSYEGYQLYTAQSTLQTGLAKFAVPGPRNASLLSDRVGMVTLSDMGVAGGSTDMHDNFRFNGTRPDHEESDYINVTSNVLCDGEISGEELFPDNEISADNISDMSGKHTNWMESDSLLADKDPSLNNSITNDQPMAPVKGFKTTPPKECFGVQSNRHDREMENVKISTSYHGTQRSPSKAGDASFVSDFYNHSRLHHLSTWKAEFMDYVNKLQASGDGSFPGREKLRKLHCENSGKDSSVDNFDSDFSSNQSRIQGNPQRVIMHVDMDCFFVSVGLRDHPELRGKPVAVTHSRGKGAKPNPGADLAYERTMWETNRLKSKSDKKGKNSIMSNSDYAGPLDDEEEVADDYSMSDKGGTSSREKVVKDTEEYYSMAEIASCSYEARKAGVKNGTFMGPAKRLCPDLVTIPYEFEKYNQVSKQLYSIVASYTHDIEAVSCDEMLVDCTDLLADTGTAPLDFASLLREEIYEKTGCPASAGLGPNILLARMSTRRAKPNGQFYLGMDQVLSFISAQSIKDLPGIGWAMSRKLTSMNIQTCGDMQKVALPMLQKEFGPKIGQSLFRYCRGQDDRPIKMERERKSVSAEINYGIRFTKDSEADKFVAELCEEVHNRLEKIGSKGRSITLKLKVRRDDAPVETAKFLGHGICNSLSKSVMLPMATNNSQFIAKECIAILRAMRVNAADLRGVGIQMQKLEPVVIGSNAAQSGHQSILNFAIPKISHTPKVTEVPKITDVPKATEVSNLTEVQVDKEQSTGGSGTPVTASGTEKGLEMTNTRLICPGQQMYPPLPMLPSFHTPEKMSSPVRQIPQTEMSSSVQGQGHTSPEDYLPSPSQVDPNVLKELPSDIREQIEKAMEDTKRRKQACKNNIINPRDHVEQHPINAQEERPPIHQRTVNPQKQRTVNALEDRPGCSHWSNSQTLTIENIEMSPERGTNQGTDSTPIRDHSIVPLPSPSQLDLDCLNALPEELQKEIRQAYEQQGKQNKPASNPSDTGHSKLSGWETIMSAAANSPSKKASSPHKGRSPRRNKNSPQFKVPQGRPGRKKKHSPKKLDFNKPPSIVTPQVTHNQPVVIVSHSKADEDLEIIESFPSIPESTSPADYTLESNVTGELTPYVNLCGRFTLTDVKSLLKEWLHTCPVPESEDEDIIVHYLSELVLDKNLELVDLVLKFLRRQVFKIASNQWSKALTNIVKDIQTFIFTQYGSHLKGFT